MLTNGEEEKTPLALRHTSRRSSTSSGHKCSPTARSLSRGRDETVQLKAQLAAALAEVESLKKQLAGVKFDAELALALE